jgi:cell wall assembly regulator SMI1
MAETLWSPIEQTLRAESESALARLGAAASDEDLANLRGALGTRALPEPFVSAWRAHDGEALGRDETLLRGRLFLPLRAMQSEYEALRERAANASGEVEADEGVRATVWTEGWVPFVLLGGASDFHCVDLDPADGGQPGQVIEVSRDLRRRKLVAPDLATYFARCAEAIADQQGAARSKQDSRSQSAAPSSLQKSAQRAQPPAGSQLSLALAIAFWGTLLYAFARHSKVAGFVAFVLWLAYVLLRFAQKSKARGG